MEYRDLGATGKRVSVIGLGCEYLDGLPYEQVKATIDAALAHGINIFDVFMPGEAVRANIARALGDQRRDVVIQGHIGSTDIRQQYDISRDLPTVRRYFETLLRLFGGYIDCGMMFFIDSQQDYEGVFETEFVDYVRALHAQGEIGHIGFSAHNPRTAMRVLDTGLPETMLFSINPAFDMLPPDAPALDHMNNRFGESLFRGIDPDRAALYSRCSSAQVGITVMKSLGGGKLLSAEHSPFAGPLTVSQCIQYALDRPAVASVMVGCRTPQEVEQAVAFLDASEEARDYAPMLGSMRNDFRGNCVYCGHCQPCPVGIDIASVNRYLDIARLTPDSIPPSIRSHYCHLGSRGDACTQCKSCEQRCPFSVPVAANMAEAERLLGD